MLSRNKFIPGWWLNKNQSREIISKNLDDKYTKEEYYIERHDRRDDDGEEKIKHAIYHHLSEIHVLHEYILKMLKLGYKDAHYSYDLKLGILYIYDGAGLSEKISFNHEFHVERPIFGSKNNHVGSGNKIFATANMLKFTNDAFEFDVNEDLRYNVFFKNWLGKIIVMCLHSLIYKVNNSTVSSYGMM